MHMLYNFVLVSAKQQCESLIIIPYLLGPPSYPSLWLGVLNKINLLLTVLEARKWRWKLQQIWCLVSLLGCQIFVLSSNSGVLISNYTTFRLPLLPWTCFSFKTPPLLPSLTVSTTLRQKRGFSFAYNSPLLIMNLASKCISLLHLTS